jgi:hypothetical protein
MSKTYIVSRNGGTVTKAPINDNKIPIYANETALDADLANIPDNTLVATRGGHDDVIDQMKEYIRNQNELSDWEEVTLPDSYTSALTMQYDGFLSCSCNAGSGAVTEIYINNERVAQSAYSNSFIIPFKKYDRVHYGGVYPNYAGSPIVAYYKKRDYSNRQ